MLSLYQPEKYKVYLGEGKSLGFCTVWNEPESIFKKSKIIRDKVALLGSLYSQYGVNIILRNLALNPQIRKVFIWGNGSLSNTQFGLAGKSILQNIWKRTAENSKANFEIDKAVDLKILEKIARNVELIDLSEKTFGEAEKIISREAMKDAAPYMEPAVFPETKLENIRTFPSEEIGWLIRGGKILEVWSRVAEKIMRYGLIKGTQYGYQQKELIGVTWVISEEDSEKSDLSLANDWPEDLKNITGVNQRAIREYQRVFLSSDLPEGISYTYGSRLRNYPQGINQIENIIIRQLKESPDTRRACATTMVPAIDKDSKEPPCLTQIQALQGNGKLHLLATFRSQDIFKAGIPNVFGLRNLQKEIVQKTGFEIGQLQIVSQSAHIYEQDWDNAYKLVKCLIWERKPKEIFDPLIQSDPRGNILININNAGIAVSLQTGNGQELIRLKGKTAKELADQIAHLNLLSRPDHFLDIGMELQKAETAFKKGIEYKQDQPLNFDYLIK